MKSKPPPERRKFADAWDEIGYLYDKLLYWLYQRDDANKASPFAERLAKLLATADPKQDSIFGQECRSLVYEARGNLPKAIAHREKEIGLIRRLHEISRDAPHEGIVHQQYGYDDLSDRLDLLAVLYHDSGEMDKALATLRGSKRICEEHGIAFDGDDLYQDYLEEKGRHQGDAGMPRPRETAPRRGAG